MEKNEEAPASPPSSPEQLAMLEMIYAVRTLAENLDVMHRDLRSVIEADTKARDREIDRIKEIVQDSAQLLQVLPIQTADRLDRLIDRKVDGVLSDARHSLEELRTKLTIYMSTRQGQEALPAMDHDEDPTVNEAPIPPRSRRETVRTFFRARKTEQVWSVVRWFAAAIAITGGGWVILEKLFR